SFCKSDLGITEDHDELLYVTAPIVLRRRSPRQDHLAVRPRRRRHRSTINDAPAALAFYRNGLVVGCACMTEAISGFGVPWPRYQNRHHGFFGPGVGDCPHFGVREPSAWGVASPG